MSAKLFSRASSADRAVSRLSESSRGIPELADRTYLAAGLIAIGATTAISGVLNGLALRAGLVGYSMTTLAFAELMALGVGRGFLNSGGNTGATLSDDLIPGMFQGLGNTPRLFWLSLGLLIFVYATVWTLETKTKFRQVGYKSGKIELRTEMLGYNVYGYKLVAAITASCLASVCGVVYGLVVGGAQPTVAQVLFCLGLVVMVNLGGRHVVWGSAYWRPPAHLLEPSASHSDGPRG